VTAVRESRQGTLVENSALEKVERECSLDADERVKARAVGALRRKEQHFVSIAQITEEIGILFPRCLRKEAAAIAADTAARGSGRVRRTAAGENLEEWFSRLNEPRCAMNIPSTMRYWRSV
jgi:hypothetical protein